MYFLAQTVWNQTKLGSSLALPLTSNVITQGSLISHSQCVSFSQCCVLSETEIIIEITLIDSLGWAWGLHNLMHVKYPAQLRKGYLEQLERAYAKRAVVTSKVSTWGENLINWECTVPVLGKVQLRCARVQGSSSLTGAPADHDSHRTCNKSQRNLEYISYWIQHFVKEIRAQLELEGHAWKKK